MNLLTDARMELMRRRLAAAGASVERAPANVTAVDDISDGRLRIAERRMWKIYDLDRESISHNIGLVLHFGGTYTLDSVIASFELMVRNADVLGSVVAVDDAGIPRRVPVRRDGRWVEPGAIWEWGTSSASEDIPVATGPIGRAQVNAAASALAKAPFDLSAEPPLRARVHATESGEISMVLVVHHLAVDDTSWSLLLGALISGSWPQASGEPVSRRPDTPPGPDVLDRALRHATATWAAPEVRFPLSGALPELTAAQSWLAPLSDNDGVRLENPIDPARITALHGVAGEVGATLNATLIAVCALSVYALTDAADHVLLVPAENRRAGEEQDRVGYSGNIVPMRFSLAPESSVREALRDAVSAVYRAMEFATVDYGTILTALRNAGGRFPVAEIMASVRNAPLSGIPVPANARVTCESVFNGVGNYPLTFAFEIGADDGVHLEIDYQPAAVDAEFARRASEMAADVVARLPRSLDERLGQFIREIRKAESS